MPAYLIATGDDPIIPVEDIARIDPIDNLHIEVHPHGGHCGFIEDYRLSSWSDRYVLNAVEGSRAD